MIEFNNREKLIWLNEAFFNGKMGKSKCDLLGTKALFEIHECDESVFIDT